MPAKTHQMYKQNVSYCNLENWRKNVEAENLKPTGKMNTEKKSKSPSLYTLEARFCLVVTSTLHQSSYGEGPLCRPQGYLVTWCSDWVQNTN